MRNKDGILVRSGVPARLKSTSLLLTASLEGLGLFIGYGKDENEGIDAMIEVACTSFLYIIESGCVP